MSILPILPIHQHAFRTPQTVSRKMVRGNIAHLRSYLILQLLKKSGAR